MYSECNLEILILFSKNFLTPQNSSAFWFMTKRGIESDGGAISATTKVDDEENSIALFKTDSEPDLWIYVKSCQAPSKNIWPDITTKVERYWPSVNPERFGGGMERALWTTDSETMRKCTNEYLGI